MLRRGSTVTSNVSRQDIARELAIMLTRCLAARGTAVWSCTRDEAGNFTLVVEARSGRVAPSDSFANAVATTMSAFCKYGEDAMLLGVPILREDRLLGVIEVNQVPASRRAVRAGYLRFMEQTAEIVGFSAAF